MMDTNTGNTTASIKPAFGRLRSFTASLPWMMLWLFAGSCQRELRFEEGTSAASSSITYSIKFEHWVGNVALQPDVAYVNPFNESYRVSTLKYYVSGIELLGNDASRHNEYYLVDLQKASSQKIVARAKAGNYTHLSFLLGVDSLRNVSGAQTGALDPVNGMFWTWNTGYIMFKLEGNSPASEEPDKRITYHIGGFRTPLQTQRVITLPLPETLQLTPFNDVEITLRCHVNGFFNAVHALPIAGNAQCTAPGPLAAKYADNYAQIFDVSTLRQ